jgi:MtN3 and saliva related transmembrane protein
VPAVIQVVARLNPPAGPLRYRPPRARSSVVRTRPERQSAVTPEVLPLTDALAVLAASWGVIMALSPVLQLRRILERRSSADLSIAYLSVLQVGFTLWIAYGAALGNLAIAVPNTVAFLVGAATIAIALRFRNQGATDAG